MKFINLFVTISYTTVYYLSNTNNLLARRVELEVLWAWLYRVSRRGLKFPWEPSMCVGVSFQPALLYKADEIFSNSNATQAMPNISSNIFKVFTIYIYFESILSILL